jgi:acetylornithine deacetylase/succinyl-diaminopimelate desuccinylase-like protein
LDFRLVPNQDSSDILKKLRVHLDKRGFEHIKIEYLISEEAGKSRIEDMPIQIWLKEMENVYNTKPEVHITNLGSGPIHEIASVFDIPVVQIGAGYPGTAAHAPNENIRINDYFMNMQAFEAYLFALGGNNVIA